MHVIQARTDYIQFLHAKKLITSEEIPTFPRIAIKSSTDDDETDDYRLLTPEQALAVGYARKDSELIACASKLLACTNNERTDELEQEWEEVLAYTYKLVMHLKPKGESIKEYLDATHSLDVKEKSNWRYYARTALSRDIGLTGPIYPHREAKGVARVSNDIVSATIALGASWGKFHFEQLTHAERYGDKFVYTCPITDTEIEVYPEDASSILTPSALEITKTTRRIKVAEVINDYLYVQSLRFFLIYEVSRQVDLGMDKVNFEALTNRMNVAALRHMGLFEAMLANYKWRQSIPSEPQPTINEPEHERFTHSIDPPSDPNPPPTLEDDDDQDSEDSPGFF